MRRILVCVTGMPGSGKSVVVEGIAKELQCPVLSMGDVVREEAKRRGVKGDLKSMMEFAKQLREEMGPMAVAELTAQRVRRINSKVILIDGVRSLDEIACFSKEGAVITIAVHASPRTRFRRLLHRGRPDDPSNWEDFRERDFKELSFGIGSVIALADIMIVNEGKGISDIRREAISKLREELENVSVASEERSQTDGGPRTCA